MADLSKIRLNNTNYNLKDKQARDFLEKGWIPTGMEYVDFYDEESETYTRNKFFDCSILRWYNENQYIYFYSYNTTEGKYFHSANGETIDYNPQASLWVYTKEDGTSIESNEEGFPEIQGGYKSKSISPIYIDIEPGSNGTFVTTNQYTYNQLLQMAEEEDNIICLRYGEQRWYLLNSGEVPPPVVGTAIVGDASLTI